MVRDADFACRASAVFYRPNLAFFKFSTRPPSSTPRALAAASAALVRSDMARRSELRTVIPLATLDLDEFRQRRCAETG